MRVEQRLQVAVPLVLLTSQAGGVPCRREHLPSRTHPTRTPWTAMSAVNIARTTATRTINVKRNCRDHLENLETDLHS